MSLPITWDDVVAIAPELSTTGDATRTSILAGVHLQVVTDTWGDLDAQGAAYLAAHLATLTKLRGKGPVTAEAEDRLSRSYADLTKFGPLGLTAYGVEYERLLYLLPTALGAVF